ncbi:MAG: 5-formyltetrahydrofolate cyclo-ligase [Oscillospiraceae bacterium]|nr:5-formyltetrahydrofolate cyclo-ligase [Oscillospiraceae bacterium]
MGEVGEAKSRLRRELLAKRCRITDKADKDAAILAKLLALDEFANADLVLTYVSVDSEADTRALITHCHRIGKAVAVPAIVDEVMRFYLLTPADELDLSDLRLCERTLCVVPGVAFDNNNQRLGYGGGYYDRFLAETTAPMTTVGLCYSELTVNVPTEPHDECVDIVLTEEV